MGAVVGEELSWGWLLMVSMARGALALYEI